MGPTDIPLGFDPGFRRTYMFHETLEGFALKGGFPHGRAVNISFYIMSMLMVHTLIL